MQDKVCVVSSQEMSLIIDISPYSPWFRPGALVENVWDNQSRW